MPKRRTSVSQGKRNASLLSAIALLGVFAAPAFAEDAPTAASGIYSAAQAERGQAVYDRHCVTCHAVGMAGGGAGSPPLVGRIFLIGWRNESVGALLDYLRTTMPTGMAGSLTDQQYADVLALMLKANGFPESADGAELATDPAALMDVPMSAE